MPRKAKPWRWTVGGYGATVTAFEREAGGVLYLAVPKPSGGERKVSLGHRDRDLAMKEAAELSAKRQAGDDKPAGPLTVASMFALYLTSVKGTQGKVHSGDTHRAAELWTRFLGPDFKVQKFRVSDWENFQRLRGSGEIDARGNLVPDAEEREPVGARIVAKDLKALRAACARASIERTDNDGFLLTADPTRGLSLPVESNPRRPIVGADRVDALLAVAHQVTMRVGYGKEARWMPSYFPTLVRLGADTGRRISSILALRVSDWKPGLGANGKILWRASSDKVKKDWLVSVTPEVRAELERVRRERLLVGDALLFPAPNNPDKPLDEQRAIDWLRKAETLAGLDHIKGGAYHCLRRKWATERKDMSPKDVAAVGGWRDVTTLQKVYQVADDETMEAVVMLPRRLRKLG